jgi:hypothetical protein
MARKVWHVRWDPQKRKWFVKRSGRQRYREYDVKKVAVEVAKEVAKRNEPSQLMVHKQDGTMNASYEYG